MNGSKPDVTDVLVPMATVVCPVHGRFVLAGPNGGLLGRCAGCVEEAERGLRVLMERAHDKASEN